MSQGGAGKERTPTVDRDMPTVTTDCPLGSEKITETRTTEGVGIEPATRLRLTVAPKRCNPLFRTSPQGPPMVPGFQIKRQGGAGGMSSPLREGGLTPTRFPIAPLALSQSQSARQPQIGHTSSHPRDTLSSK